MTKQLMIIGLSCSLIFFTSCGEDEINTEQGKTFTSEEHKANLHKSGSELADEMDNLKETKSANAIVSLYNRLEEEENNTGGRLESFQPVSGMAKFSKGKIGTRELVAEQIQEDPESMAQIWEENKGLHEWNFDTKKFDFTEGEDKIIIKFPSSESSTTNDAVFTIRNYEGTKFDNLPEDLEYNGDLPTNLLMDLVIDGTKEMEFSFEASYTDEGEPKSVVTSLLLNPYKINFSASNSEALIKSDASILNGDKNLIATGFEIGGNFDADNIEQNTNENADESDIGNIITNGSLYIQLLDVKVSGSIADVTALAKELDATFEGECTEGYDYEKAADELEVIMNKHLVVNAIYASTGVKIADAEYYTTVEEEDDEFTTCPKYIEPGVRLVFSDTSKVNLEVYFETGFEDIEKQLEDLADEIEEDFS